MRHWQTVIAVAVIAAGCFTLGWYASGAVRIGEQAMASFMSEASALGYLQKGDVQRAMVILRDSAERNLLLADRHGTPQLDWHSPGARFRWFAEYAIMRDKLPVSMPEAGSGFDQEVEEVLSKSVKRK